MVCLKKIYLHFFATKLKFVWDGGRNKGKWEIEEKRRLGKGQE